jgi:S-adenosylmethionine decarboxylase
LYFARKRWLILNTLTSISEGKTTETKPIPGLHIVANFAASQSLLRDSPRFRSFILNQIKTEELRLVGEVFHNFDGGGFTAVLCLTESHLSVHTWPEHGYMTFDIFLSNYLKDNREKTQRVYRAVADYFDAKVLFEQIINR